MSDTPPPPQPQEAAFFTAIRGWRVSRSSEGFLGGVASGVGERIGLAKLPARLILVLLALLLSGIVPLAYAAAWALLPDRDGNIVIQNFGRGITNVGALIGIAIFALIGALNLDSGLFGNNFNIGWNSPDVSGFGQYDGAIALVFGVIAVGFGLLLVAGVVVGIVFLIRRSKRTGTANAAPYSPHPGSTPGANDTDAQASDESPVNGATSQGAKTAPPEAATPGQPQPWEAAVMPGDPAVTGATTASAAWNQAGYSPVPPAPPRPPKPRVAGPGKRFYLITAAWVLISIAIVSATERIDRLAVDQGLAWLAVFTIGFGLILVGIAVSGRRLGFLGFVSVPLLIVGMLTAVNSGELGDAFDSATVEVNSGDSADYWDYWEEGVHYSGDGTVIDEIPYENPEIADPTALFADDFQQVKIAPICYDWDLNHPGSWTEEDGTVRDEPVVYGSNARLTYADLTADATVDVTAEHTVVTIPAGTNLVLAADYNSQASLEWESRGLYCDFWGGEMIDEYSPTAATYLSLINPGAPVLTLAVHDDQYANTIEIIETPAVATQESADPEATSSPQPAVTPEGNQS